MSLQSNRATIKAINDTTTYSEGFYILTAKIIMKSRFDNRSNTKEKLKPFLINPLKKTEWI